MIPNDVHRQLIADPLSVYAFVIECAAMKLRHAKVRRRRVELLEIAEVSAAYKKHLKTSGIDVLDRFQTPMRPRLVGEAARHAFSFIVRVKQRDAR